MKKIISTIILFGAFGMPLMTNAQDSDAQDGYEQRTKPCPNNSEKLVERCVWVTWDSSCDPSVQELC